MSLGETLVPAERSKQIGYRRTPFCAGTRTSESLAGRLLHRPVDTGFAYWGPGDRYTFLVSIEQFFEETLERS